METKGGIRVNCSCGGSGVILLPDYKYEENIEVQCGCVELREHLELKESVRQAMSNLSKEKMGDMLSDLIMEMLPIAEIHKRMEELNE